MRLSSNLWHSLFIQRTVTTTDQTHCPGLAILAQKLQIMLITEPFVGIQLNFPRIHDPIVVIYWNVFKKNWELRILRKNLGRKLEILLTHKPYVKIQ
jgi:hypothetical protein